MIENVSIIWFVKLLSIFSTQVEWTTEMDYQENKLLILFSYELKQLLKCEQNNIILLKIVLAFSKNVTPDKNALHFSYAFLKSPHEPVCSPGISLGQEYERRNETNGM